MSARRRHVVTVAILAGAALAVTSGCAVWRVQRSAELARASEPFQNNPDNPVVRVLIVGDSTAVGTGASSGRESLAGLMARQQPRAQIENRARDGAKFADVLAQLVGEQRFDVVLVQAGGNDVIRLRGLDALQTDIDRVADRARELADTVVLMPAGNVGNAPFFVAPVSWWMTQRSRALHRLVRESAARTGAVYVNLFHERSDDPFVSNPELNASDGLHPSDAGYVVWFEQLQVQAGLSQKLSGPVRRP
jgi:lysophospholipase L1-like esterase